MQSHKDYEFRIGTITSVNSDNTQVVFKDRHGGLVQITMHLQGAVAVIPQVDDIWMVRRTGVDWFLEKKIDNNPMTPIENMSQGDHRVEASNTLHLNGATVTLSGTQILVNGVPLPGITLLDNGTAITTTPRYRLNFVDGHGSTWTIQDNPNLNACNVTLSGSFDGTYTYSGTRIFRIDNQGNIHIPAGKSVIADL